jgi:copper chaperone NosL
MKTFVFLVMAIVILACEDASRPLEPVWGKQACAHCAMLLSEPRFGAQLTTEAGDRYYFDDPGCMASFVRERAPRVRVRAMWVHDPSGWVDAKSARYELAASPMDYGYAPSSQGTADWLAVEQAAAQRGEKR